MSIMLSMMLFAAPAAIFYEDPKGNVGRILSDIVLPEVAGKREEYNHYFFADGDYVDVVFTVEESANVNYIVLDRNNLPLMYGGGCSFIKAKYNVRTRTFSMIRCNKVE